MSFLKLTVDWFVVKIKKKNHVTKADKRKAGANPRISRFISLCNYKWELLSPWVSSIKSIWITADTIHIKTEHFCCWILKTFFSPIWFQHYLLFTQVWCELQTLESALLDLIRHLSPSRVWLSPHQLHVWGEERHRDISALLSFQSELYSPRVPLGVWLVISTACVSAGSSVLILLGWSRTKWTQRPEITVELVFFVEIDQGSYLASNLFFLI